MTSPPTTCPEPGLWRAWLDREAADQPAELASADDHLSGCSACRATVDELRRNADLAAAALGRLAPAAPPSAEATELARARAARCTSPHRSREPAIDPAGENRRLTVAMTAHRWRIALGGLAAALALTFLVGTPEGRTAAAAFLAQFRGQRLAVVTISSNPVYGRNPVAELEQLGTVQGGRRGRPPEEVRTVAEASQRAGFPVKAPDPAALPAGVGATPRILVSPAHEVRFTFDREKARAYFRSKGRPEVALPDRFHGATLVVGVPAMALLEYGGPSRDRGLVVAQAGELTAGVEGSVGLDELREFILSLPDLPPDAVRQLRGMQDWRNVLPIPVQADRMSWQQVTVAGAPGFLLAENTGLGNAVVWLRGGRVYGVAGAAPAAEILRVANGLP